MTNPTPLRPLPTPWRLAALLATLAVTLAACGGDDTDPSTDEAGAATSVEAEPSTVDDTEQAVGEPTAGPEDTSSEPVTTDEQRDSVLVTVGGEELYADVDSMAFVCARIRGETSVQALTDGGADVAVTTDGATADIAVTMPSGAAYNAAAGGVLNVTEQAEGVVRISATVEDLDSGERTGMEIRIVCTGA